MHCTYPGPRSSLDEKAACELLHNFSKQGPPDPQAALLVQLAGTPFWKREKKRKTNAYPSKARRFQQSTESLCRCIPLDDPLAHFVAHRSRRIEHLLHVQRYTLRHLAHASTAIISADCPAASTRDEREPPLPSLPQLLSVTVETSLASAATAPAAITVTCSAPQPAKAAKKASCCARPSSRVTSAMAVS